MKRKSNLADKKPRILIAPLDWGLGHATRCIAVVRELLESGAEPVIGAYGQGLIILKNEFPQLEVIEMPGFSLSYPGKYGLRLKVVASLPRMVYSIYKEHRLLKRIIAEKKIDGVISDSRFGLFAGKISTVYMSHQVLVKLPDFLKTLEYPFYLLTSLFTKKYTLRWIPDTPGSENLSGDLGHKYGADICKFIGTLNRFDGSAVNPIEKEYDVLIIISGLEKQRTVFEQLILKQVKNLYGLKILIVLGKPAENTKKELNKDIVVHSHLPAAEMYRCIAASRLVVCRSGYSTLMELASLGKKAVLVPTPGQTEQEYLAKYLEIKGYAPYYNQKDLLLSEALSEVDKYSGLPRLDGSELLREAVDEFMRLVRKSREAAFR